MTVVTRRRAVVTGVCLVAVLAAGAGTWALVDLQSPSSAAASGGSDAGKYRGTTATVTKGDLTDSKVFAGTLGYGTPAGVPGSAPGTLTWLPKPGQVITSDEFLYAVDERGVRAMHGTVPLWRSLERGLKGTDVRQLNDNLAALGYDVSQDDVFGPRTQRAVKQWQKDRGHEVTDLQPSAGEDAGSKVDVSVSFDPGTRKLPAAASAQIDAAGSTEKGVLSVPVAALVTTGSGKYAVDVVRRDGTTKRVPVTPGFIADGKIAITGNVSEGDRVVVPG